MKLAAAAAVLFAAPAAWALCPPDLTVDTFADTTTDATCTSTCSLRSALAIGSDCAAMPIVLPAGTYTIGSTLTVSGTQQIVGEGAAQTIIDAAQHGRAMTVSGSLSLSGVTLIHGRVTGRGGAMVVTGTLTASDVIFANNQATTQGGGLAVESSGSASCVNCIASGNGAASGGGIVVAGSLTWSDGQILDNTATGQGGGVASESGSASVALARSMVSGNTAASGGGLIVSVPFNLQATTIANNHATSGDGGGIVQLGSSLAMQNVTLSGNTASGQGGGVRVIALSVDNWQDCTISANQAASGGGIALTATSGVGLSGVLVSGNTAVSDADCLAAPSVASAGHNLITPSAGCLVTPAASDVAGDAKLLSLADNGGPVPTHALAAGSHAIDNGSPELPMDARGVSRPQGIAADIGAFERGAAVLSVTGASAPSTAAAGTTVLHSYRVTNLGPTPAVQVSVSASGSVVAASSTPGSCTAAVCALGAIAPGDSATVTLLVTGTLASRVVASANNATDAALQLATTVTPSADLVLSATPSSSAVDLGAQTEVTVSVHNTGPSGAQIVSLTVTPGSETFLVPAPLAPVTCTISNGVASCALGAIASGATQTVTVAMSASALGQLTFHAQVASEVADPVQSNNAIDQSIAVTGVNAQSAAPTSSASGVSNPGTGSRKSGCAAVAPSWWMLSLVVWWRRPRQSWSRR